MLQMKEFHYVSGFKKETVYNCCCALLSDVEQIRHTISFANWNLLILKILNILKSFKSVSLNDLK